MLECILGFAGFGLLIIVLAVILDQFDFSFLESGQEPRGMGGPVPCDAINLNERLKKNNPTVFVKGCKEFVDNRKADLTKLAVKTESKVK